MPEGLGLEEGLGEPDGFGLDEGSGVEEGFGDPDGPGELEGKTAAAAKTLLLLLALLLKKPKVLLFIPNIPKNPKIEIKKYVLLIYITPICLLNRSSILFSISFLIFQSSNPINNIVGKSIKTKNPVGDRKNAENLPSCGT